VLLVNDDFGALATALLTLLPTGFTASSPLTIVQDNSAGRAAIIANLHYNSALFPETSVLEAISVQSSLAALPAGQSYSCILLKVPKSVAAFGEQLRVLRPLCGPQTRLFCAGMTKHLPKRAQIVLERVIGPAARRPAKRKARLFATRLAATLTVPASNWPKKQWVNALQAHLLCPAGVFSPERADPASEYLCAHLPPLDSVRRILDLGCGTGILGLVAARRQTQASVYFTDSSALAITTARHNVRALAPQMSACFLSQHRLLPWAEEPIDLILCNPPFHERHVVTPVIAYSMFADARAVLRTGGQLLVVANRHLPYQRELRRLFRQHDLLAENKTFRIHRACN